MTWLLQHAERKKIEFPRVTSHTDGKDRGKNWPACRPVEGRKRKKERKKKEKRRKGRRRGWKDAEHTNVCHVLVGNYDVCLGSIQRDQTMLGLSWKIHSFFSYELFGPFRSERHLNPKKWHLILIKCHFCLYLEKILNFEFRPKIAHFLIGLYGL